MDKKKSISLFELCEGLPIQFYEYLLYCRNLKFDQQPNYDYLKSLFVDIHESIDNSNELFEWNTVIETNKKVSLKMTELQTINTFSQTSSLTVDDAQRNNSTETEYNSAQPITFGFRGLKNLISSKKISLESK